MKNPPTPAGIELATFRFVAQHLNHCATVVSLPSTVWTKLQVVSNCDRLPFVSGNRTPEATVYSDRLENWSQDPVWLSRLGFCPFNRTQPRAVIGLHTGHNILRIHLHLMGLSDSPLCGRCGAENETSVHSLCECVALASHRHVYLGSFLELEDITSLSLGTIWNFSKVTGLLWIDIGHKEPVI